MPLLQVSRRVVETSHVVKFFAVSAPFLHFPPALVLWFLIFPTLIFLVLGALISDLSNFYISSAWCRWHSIWLCDLSLEMWRQEGVCHLPQGFSVRRVFFSLTSYIVVGLHKHSRRPWGGRACKAGEVSFCIMLVILQLMESVRIEFRKERKEDVIKVAVEKYTAE